MAQQESLQAELSSSQLSSRRKRVRQPSATYICSTGAPALCLHELMKLVGYTGDWQGPQTAGGGAGRAPAGGKEGAAAEQGCLALD